jgi:hypothetical protein
MKGLPEDELRYRLRRTLTNKFSQNNTPPKHRNRLREIAFKNVEFVRAVDKATRILFELNEQNNKHYAQINKERENRINDKRKSKKRGRRRGS